MTAHGDGPRSVTFSRDLILGVAIPHRLARFGSRFAMILSGEMIQSLFHFALNVLLARKLGVHDYGLFAIVFTLGAVGVTYIRALMPVPATLNLARSLGSPALHDYAVMLVAGA